MSYLEWFLWHTQIFWYIVAINVILAISDGKISTGKKAIGKQIRNIGYAGIFFLGVMFVKLDYSLLVTIFSFIFVRFGLFNTVHNLSAGWRIDFIGTTDFTDRALRNVNKAFLPMLYIVSLCLGFGLVFNYNF